MIATLEKPAYSLDDQIALLDQIREKVIADPLTLDVHYYHSDEGSSHSINGWLETIRPQASLRVDLYVGQLLPDFLDIERLSNELALEWFKYRCYALEHGDVVQVDEIYGEAYWMDRTGNVFYGHIDIETARVRAASNHNCFGCIECDNCISCNLCENCQFCECCDSCIRLTRGKDESSVECSDLIS